MKFGYYILHFKLLDPEAEVVSSKVLTRCLLTIALLLAGCSSTGNQNKPAQVTESSKPAVAPGFLNLAAPTAMLAQSTQKHVSTSFDESDVMLNGSQFDTSLSFNHVVANATEAEFSPTWDKTAASHPLSDLGFCIYHFDIPGYDRDPRLILDWSASEDTSIFVGIANWDTDRWEWYYAFDNVNLPGGSMDPYLNIGYDMLVVVAVIGTDQLKLSDVHVGSYPPDPALSVSATYGHTPFEFDMDASASLDQGGLPVQFQFDPDGDGVFDSGAPSDTATYHATLNTNGTYQATVRVINSAGIHKDLAVEVYAVSNWTRTWSWGGSETYRDCAIAADGMIYAVGVLSDPDNAFAANLLLAKYTPSGNLIWIRDWYNGDSDTGRALSIDSDGNLIVAGTTRVSGSLRFLLQKWNTDGALLWSESIGNPGTNNNTQLFLDSNTIYLAGSTDGAGSNGTNLYLAKIDTNGTLVWQRYRDSGQTQDDLQSLTPITSNLGLIGLTLLGTSTSGNTLTWRTEYSLSGSLGSEKQFAAGAKIYSPRLTRTYNLVSGTAAYYIAGQYDNGVEFQTVVSRSTEGGGSIWCKSIDSANYVPNSISFQTDGHLLVTGFQGLNLVPWLQSFDTLTGATSFSEEYIPSGGGGGKFRNETRSNGVLICGDSQDYNLVLNSIAATTTTQLFDWTSVTMTGGTANLSAANAPGTVTDVKPLGTENPGGSAGVALLYFRADL